MRVEVHPLSPDTTTETVPRRSTRLSERLVATWASVSGGVYRSLDQGPRPRFTVGLLLNVLSIGFALAIATAIGEAELMLAGLWLTLVLGAFVFSIRVALARIIVGALFVLAYMTAEAIAEAGGLQIELIDLAEWPLLLTISIIVALMAHRLSTTSRRYAALYRQASDRLVSAQEQERARLSQDLHDSVGQTLTAALLSLEAADNDLRYASGPTTTVRAGIHRAQDLTTAALEETRDVAARLRPPRIHEIGLGAAIRDLAGRAGMHVDVRFDPAILPPGMLRAEQEIGAYRIVQEAIGNAARHSGAGNIWIGAWVAEREIRLEVGDDGVGFDAAAGGSRGMGLAGMNERAAVLEGHVSVRSDPRSGTRVTLVLPRQPAAPARPASGLAAEAGR